MKRLLLPLLLLSLIFVQANAQDQFFTTAYTSLTIPELYHGSLFSIDNQGISKSQPVDDLKHDKTLLIALPLAISAVTVYQEDKNGGLTIAGQSVSASGSNYVVIYDFTQTQQISVNKNDGSSVSGLIGIAVRMTASIHTKKANINLANLFGLGLAASQNKLYGSLEVKAFGMSSQKINELIPVTADLSTGTIQNALTSVATIKSHIYDDGTTITPLWLAFNVSGNKTSKQGPIIDFNQVQSQIKGYQPQQQQQQQQQQQRN